MGVAGLIRAVFLARPVRRLVGLLGFSSRLYGFLRP